MVGKIRRLNCWIPGRWPKKNMVLILTALIVALAGIVCLAQVRADSDLIETYKELEQKDFELQRSGSYSEEVEKRLREIYWGAQLDKALDYFRELAAKGLCLQLDTVKYREIKVLEHSWDSAVLLVESSYSGDFVKSGKENERMRELAVDSLCQVELARKDNKWKIANVIMLKE